MFEYVPSGQQYLKTIVEAMKELWLRKEIAGKIKRMWNKYKEEAL